ncbi:hypothetical protein CANARDRAFT_27182 [[Candida] arabinofermentans NRRL YB-2248]|uniref:Uncharacterized protein n=1 Tax=[Candida] arabinofermentans NRRL YB-2248 TaxID=983967 RepID=A0A1E4T4X4_9ASCO|nr:hypothetical protein CANARDRAFT_27182 [[Candida] arabinofermentans NRRL YB-2248]
MSRTMPFERFNPNNTSHNNSTRSTESVAAHPHHQHRISRRSISKHTQPNIPGIVSSTNSSSNGQSRKSNIEILKSTLNPEWEVDYLDELGDDSNNGLKTLLDTLKSSNDVNTLQELRFLKTLNPQYQNLAFQETFDKFSNYQKVIKNSRVFLKPLFDYLLNFEQNLNKLSLEMEFLQNRSNQLNVEIQDKQQIDLQLTPIINDLIIPPEIIKSIVNDKLNENWIENLRFIIEKKEIYSKYERETKIQSLQDLNKLLEIMELKAIERIRDFIITQIKELRRQTTSSQIIQRDMLEVKEIYPFLQQRHPKLANELRQAYTHTMRWYYYQNFVKYLSSLEKLKIHKVGKHVSLGSLEEDANTAASSSFFGMAAAKPEITLNEYLINFTKRLEVMSQQDETVMLAQIAETNNTKYWLESAFRNFNQAVLDNSSTEYLFLNEFFLLTKSEEIFEISKIIFNPIHQLGYSYTEFLIDESYDLFGVLMSIRICQSMEYELQHRRIPIMEDYLNLQLIILWPKFQKLVDINCSSLKKTVSSSVFIKNINKNLMTPLSLTQNFGMVLLNLLHLSNNLTFELETSEPLTNSITRLRSEYETSMIKLSLNLDSRKREIFLYNNFFLILTILNEVDPENKLGQVEKDHFAKLVTAHTSS